MDEVTKAVLINMVCYRYSSVVWLRELPRYFVQALKMSSNVTSNLLLSP